jgi:predicted ATPase
MVRGTARAKSATCHDAHAARRRRPAAPSFALTKVTTGIVTSSCRALVVGRAS